MNEVSGADVSARNRKLERIFFVVPRIFVGTLVLALVAITGANVVARYVFLSPFFWADEALVYVMIAFVYISAIMVAWDGRHLKMDILLQLLKSPWKEIVNFMAATLFVGICAFVVVQSFQVTLIQAEFGKRSVAAEIPMVIPHSMVLIAFFFMMVAVIVRFRAYVRGDLGREHDEVMEDVQKTAKMPAAEDGI